MRQYVFDDAELRNLIDLAYRHGFVQGLSTKPERRPKDRQKQIEWAKPVFGEIIDGREPTDYTP